MLELGLVLQEYSVRLMLYLPVSGWLRPSEGGVPPGGFSEMMAKIVIGTASGKNGREWASEKALS